MLDSWIIAAMLPSAALWMLHLGIGPFGHPSLLHWHQRWRQKTARYKRVIATTSASLVLFIGTALLLGVDAWLLT